MSLSFGAASSFVQFSVGNAANVSNGAVTLIALWKPAFPGTTNTGLVGGQSSGTQRRSFLLDSGAMFGDGDFTSGVAFSGSAGDWLWLAMSKAAGASTYRMHWKNFTTGGAWTHAVASGAGTHTDPGVSNELRIGANAETASATGDTAVGAIKLANMADLAIEAACTNALADLIAVGPDWAVRFMNSAPTSIQDLIGSGHETTRSGTITNTADPAGFNFSLGSAAVLIGQQSTNRHPGRSPGVPSGRFYQSPRPTTTITAVNLSDSVEPTAVNVVSTVTSSVRALSSSVEAGHAFGGSTSDRSAIDRASAVEAGLAMGVSTSDRAAISLSSSVEAGHASAGSTKQVSARNYASSVEAGEAWVVGTRVSQSLAFSLSDAVEAATALMAGTRTVSAINRRTDVEAASALAMSARVASTRVLDTKVKPAGIGAWSTVDKTLYVLSHTVDGSFVMAGSVRIRSDVTFPSDGDSIPGGILVVAVPVSSLIDFGPVNGTTDVTTPSGTVDVLIVGRTDVGDFVGVVDLARRET